MVSKQARRRLPAFLPSYRDRGREGTTATTCHSRDRHGLHSNALQVEIMFPGTLPVDVAATNCTGRGQPFSNNNRSGITGITDEYSLSPVKI